MGIRVRHIRLQAEYELPELPNRAFVVSHVLLESVSTAGDVSNVKIFEVCSSEQVRELDRIDQYPTYLAPLASVARSRRDSPRARRSAP